MTRKTISSAVVALSLMAVPSLVHAQAQGHGQHGQHGATMQHGDSAKKAHAGMGHAGMAHGMKSPCPLHAALGTTPAQDSAIARIREAHMAQMKAMHAAHAGHQPDSAMKAQMHGQMKASMESAIGQVREVLDETQREKLAAAIAAHEAEKAEMAKAGKPHDCAMCCMEHGKQHAAPATPAGHKH
jgi:hypothetical protein